MSFFIKKMSQNVWATIMPFGPVTLIFYWPKKKISDQPWLALISGTIQVPWLFSPSKSGSHNMTENLLVIIITSIKLRVFTILFKSTSTSLFTGCTFT